MSNYQNQRQSHELEPVLGLVGGGILAITVLLLVCAKNVSDALGAEFWTTFWAIIHALVGLCMVGGLAIVGYLAGIFKVSRIKSTIGLFLSLAATVFAWSFCKVADSIDMGGVNPDDTNTFGFLRYGDSHIWASGWFQWAVCLGLIVVTALCAMSAAQDDY
jgi:hypothetical protein